MAAIPIVIHVISMTISDAGAARNEPAITIAIAADPSSASVQTPIPSVVTVNEHAALPRLIPSTSLQSSIASVMAVREHIRFASQADAPAAALRECCY